MALMVVDDLDGHLHTLCTRHRRQVDCLIVEDQSDVDDVCQLCELEKQDDQLAMDEGSIIVKWMCQ